MEDFCVFIISSREHFFLMPIFSGRYIENLIHPCPKYVTDGKFVTEEIEQSCHQPNVSKFFLPYFTFQPNCVNHLSSFRSRGLRVSTKLIMKKAKNIYDDLKNNSTEPDIESEFKASTGWLRQFIKHTVFSQRRKTAVAQKDPERLIYKLVSFVLSVRRLKINFNYEPSNIIATEETPVWTDMVSETAVDATGAKTVTMMTTAHAKCAYVSV